jgi:hypothetical protein
LKLYKEPTHSEKVYVSLRTKEEDTREVIFWKLTSEMKEL